MTTYLKLVEKPLRQHPQFANLIRYGQASKLWRLGVRTYLSIETTTK